MTVAALLQQKVDVSNPLAVGEIILDGHKIKQFSQADAEFLSTFQETKLLSMNQTYLTSLSGFPTLPKLEILELTDNKLGPASALDTLAKSCPNLHTLILAGNRLTDLSFMNGLSQLEILDVEVNPITSTKEDEASVRKALFDRFPQLKIVNSYDRNGTIINEDESALSEDEDEDDSEHSSEPQIVGDVENRQKPGRSLLQAFYEKDYNQNDDDDDDDDEDDFNPESLEDEDSDAEDDEEVEEANEPTESPTVQQAAAATEEEKDKKESVKPPKDGTKDEQKTRKRRIDDSEPHNQRRKRV